MLKQEGDKPQLTILPPVQESYSDRINQMIAKLSAQKARGETINTLEVIGLLDLDGDNSVLREWMASAGVLTKLKFDKAVDRARRNERIRKELGFVPADCPDFVAQYVKGQGIKLSANDQILRKKAVRYGEALIHAKDVEADDVDAAVRLAYRLGNASAENLEDFKLELRLVRDKLGLDYSDSNIADAVRAWSKTAHREAKMQMFMDVRYAKGRATGADGQAMWAAMEAACFDVSETRAGFAVDVIRKFMWQVKRKAAGLPITNHLMPVLTGPQGKGKSTFVEQMCGPLADTMKPVGFEMITDTKIIDIWSAHILFIDEMANFSRSDVDEVKKAITQPTLTRRPMRSNETVQIKQEATLIGCSNRSLGQLIRDDTGGRRFAELIWRTDPDWVAMNQLDWVLLWTSIDENGPDPVGAETAAMLRDQQEANRNQSSVEVWARQVTGYSKFTPSSDLHEQYQAWEEVAFPRAGVNLTMFGRTMSNLIQNLPDFPWEKQKDRKGTSYRMSV